MRLIFAAAVATVALACPAAADEFAVSYSVAPGTCKYPIPVPVDNRPINLVVAHIAGGAVQPYLIQTTFTHMPGSNPSFLRIDGWANAIGDDILCVVSNCYIRVSIGPSDKLRVCNAQSNPYGTAVGKLTFVY